MCSALDLPWSPVVSATDSSEYGYGVCERKLDVPLISRTARTCEQWRFAVEGAVKARANALKLDPNCDCPPDTELYQEARVHERNFEEVHPYILRPADWHVVFKGEWQHQENILRTEGRALVSGVRHHLRCRRFAGCRHLYLVDNLALALACCKGRGSSHLSNRTCQQLCALALVGDCKFYVRWIHQNAIVPIVLQGARLSSAVSLMLRLVSSQSVSRVSAPPLLAPGMASFSRTLKAKAKPSLSSAPGSKRTAAEAGMVDTFATLSGAQSVLEKNKVRTTATQQRYEMSLNTFLLWCQTYFHMCRDWDALLTGYLNELFAQGQDLSAAEYTFAAFRFRFPEFGKYGSLKLPRTLQALEGYRNLAPPRMRLPTPRIAFAAIVGLLLAKGLIAMAVGLLLQWDLLLRPGELVNLKPHQVVQPAPLPGLPSWGVVLHSNLHAEDTGGPSKTNVFNESLLLSPAMNYLLPALQALLKTRASAVFLFPFTCVQLGAEFKKAVSYLHLDGLQLTLYGNRHGAASHLRLQGVDLKEIKQRGRWLADSSVKRYEKATLAQQAVHQVPLQVQLYGTFVESRLASAQTLLAAAIRHPESTAPAQVRNLFKPLPEL